MRQISSTSRSTSGSQASGQDGSLLSTFAGEGYQNILEKANTVPFKKVFRLYGIRIDEVNRKITCPFKSHKGGRESTASFYFYPETNSYCCYGCRQGSSPVDFVANMDRISTGKAAQKILDNFSSDVDEDLILGGDSFSEKIKIMMRYSDAVRDFRLVFSDEKSYDFIEDNCKTFDKINKKFDLSNEALDVVVSKLIKNISEYTP